MFSLHLVEIKIGSRRIKKRLVRDYGMETKLKPLFSCVWVWRKTLALCKVFLNGFSLV